MITLKKALSEFTPFKAALPEARLQPPWGDLPQTGFTLIEVLVVIGIFGILTALSAVIGLDFYRVFAFRSERNTIVAVLQTARARAMANINQSPHGVRFDGNNYIIFQGAGYASAAHAFDQSFPANSSIKLTIPPGIPVTAANPIEVDFAQLSATTAPVALMIKDNTGRSGTTTIGADGQIDW